MFIVRSTLYSAQRTSYSGKGRRRRRRSERQRKNVISATKTPFENDNNISNLEFMNELQCDLKRNERKMGCMRTKKTETETEKSRDRGDRMKQRARVTIAFLEVKHDNSKNEHETKQNSTECSKNQQAPFIIPNKSP